MLPGMELMGCTGLAVPGEVMQHVVHVESSRNPYAIGVVGGRLVREPRGWLKQWPLPRCWSRRATTSPSD